MVTRSGWRRWGAVVVAVGLAVVPACSSSSDASGPTSTTTSSKKSSATTVVDATLKPAKVEAIGTFAVGSREETYVDATRTTTANKQAPELPQRTLPAVVLYPATGAPGPDQVVDGTPAKGPFPLILFSHGVTGRGVDYTATLRVLVSAGYVVVAPDYPLSNRNAAGGPVISDVPNQITDVSFLLDQVLAATAKPGYLKGLVDSRRIGLAGHSLGAITSLGAGYTECCAEKRVKAVAEWAGLFFSTDSKPAAAPPSVAPVAAHRPLLMVHGDADGTVPYTVTTGVYDAVGSPKVFITLPGQGHIPAYVAGESNPAAKVVADASVAFFDAELKDDATGLDRVGDVVTEAGPQVATLKQDLG